VIPFLDSTRLAAFRLALIGVGIIVLLIYRPQGLLPEPRLRRRDVVPEDAGGG
jgi:branched-chain amino acid transport system permease protein